MGRGDVPQSAEWERARSNYDPAGIYRDRRRDPDPENYYYKEGYQFGKSGERHGGYGSPWKAIQFGAGHRAARSDTLREAVEGGQPCPAEGCGKKHKSADVAIRQHIKNW